MSLPSFSYSLNKGNGEAMALLGWKATLENQSQSLLSSWLGTNHCIWPGIGCNKASHVTHVNLTGFGLRGTLSNFSFSSFPFLLHIDLSNNSF